MLTNGQVALISIGLGMLITCFVVGGAILLTKWAFSGSSKYFY